MDKKKISPVYHEKKEDPDLHYLDGVIYALDYAKNPQIKAAIKQMKYRFTREMAEYFADLIAEKIRELSMVKSKRIILIPVPLHKKRLNYRGFNQAEIIANAVATRFTADRIAVLELLERTRHTSQQAKLDKYERRKNLGGAFSMSTKFVQSVYHPEHTPCHPELVSGSTPLPCKQVDSRFRGNDRGDCIYFIVDDVCTTGSTLEECARALKENGFKKVYGLTIARAFK